MKKEPTKKWVRNFGIILGLTLCLVLVFAYFLDSKILLAPFAAPSKAELASITELQRKLIKVEELTGVIRHRQPMLDPSISHMIAGSVYDYSKEYHFPPELILALIERESSFRPTLTSKANCKGLMQINPSAHPEKLKKLNVKNGKIFHIDTNIHLGVMVLREYYDRTKNIKKALAKYVGGNRPQYVNDILSTFTDLVIGQYELQYLQDNKIIYLEPRGGELK